MKEKCIELLQGIKEKITCIQDEILGESNKIETLLQMLSKRKGITLDSNKHAEIKKGITEYINSLNEITKMANYYIEHYNEKNEAEIKRFCKKMKKDLAVSYSRFSFGFETQKRQLEYLEKTIK
jgi:predicted metal-dependent hydrolase